MARSTSLRWLFLVALTSFTSGLSGQQEGDAKPAPLTQAQALKLGVEGIVEKLGNHSEVGQDDAARLYAAAKRIETEHALALRDLSLVAQLADWRKTLSDCTEGCCELAYVVNGGGTMYSHGMARDCAGVEDFLASLAKRLPLAEGEGNAKVNQRFDEAIAYIKKLKFSEGLEPEAEEKKAFAELKEKQVANWENLKAFTSSCSAKEAARIADFALGSLGWIREEEEVEEKAKK